MKCGCHSSRYALANPIGWVAPALLWSPTPLSLYCHLASLLWLRKLSMVASRSLHTAFYMVLTGICVSCYADTGFYRIMTAFLERYYSAWAHFMFF